MLLHLGPLVEGDQALELAVAHALVRRASRADIDGALRIYRPRAAVTAFGRREVRHERFQEAVDSVRRAGFEPAVRAVGGRAVAYTDEALVVDHVVREIDSVGRLEKRFEEFGRLLVGVLRSLGVDAYLGAVPGEYCPGAHSVNAHGTVKLVGTAQRVVKDAWLFSSLVVIDDATLLRPLLTRVYEQLGADLDPSSVGALRTENPLLDLAAVEAAVLDAYGVRAEQAVPLDATTLELAHELVGRHRVG